MRILVFFPSIFLAAAGFFFAFDAGGICDYLAGFGERCGAG